MPAWLKGNSLRITRVSGEQSKFSIDSRDEIALRFQEGNAMMINLFKTNQEESHPQVFRAFLAIVLLLCSAAQGVMAQTQPAAKASQTRLVVRDSLGLNGILNLCRLLRCSSATGLGDPQGQLFMIQIPSLLAPVTSLLNISVPGLVTIETDQFVQTQGATAGAVP